MLRGVLSVPWTVVGFVVLMLSTASWTAGGRNAALPHGRRIATAGVPAGAAAGLTPALALRLVALDTRHIVAVAGIVIGGAMTAATLSGRRFRQNAIAGRDEVEGWLALGATPPQAYDEIGRLAVRESLLPNLDQTRATGMVTLPGAFVGALFGEASPASAAQSGGARLAGTGHAGVRDRGDPAGRPVAVRGGRGERLRSPALARSARGGDQPAATVGLRWRRPRRPGPASTAGRILGPTIGPPAPDRKPVPGLIGVIGRSAEIQVQSQRRVEVAQEAW
ncbi:ABC transporter permease [Nocardioides sp.]|uniref:ABC transporter permease n=1 Tax=Nocardioides sp. TaxID=35761 RepID=UPI0039E28058